jgi:hypothetical protein
MGPIGIAINGVVFFNPFDAQSTDATDLMDRCCGHPTPFGQYHYHKYPICVNSPWADEGQEHSPLIGFAFDGFPVYGPYESKDVMAKDVTGKDALNEFNMNYDDQRGWHYHVTPGKFPYIIGGYWGVEDSRDVQRGRPGGMGGGPGGRPGGPRPTGWPRHVPQLRRSTRRWPRRPARRRSTARRRSARRRWIRPATRWQLITGKHRTPGLLANLNSLARIVPFGARHSENTF